MIFYTQYNIIVRHEAAKSMQNAHVIMFDLICGVKINKTKAKWIFSIFVELFSTISFTNSADQYRYDYLKSIFIWLFYFVTIVSYA